jgi:uncharacterized membrane protein
MLPNETSPPRRRPIKSALRYLMAAFYVWTGISHFTRPEFFLSLMPPYIPLHAEMVSLSGIAEIVLGVLVAIPRTAAFAGWGIIAMLIAFLPVHVHMLVNNHLYPEAPTSMLWARFPIQALFILWAYWYTTDRPRRARAAPPATSTAAAA